jgi:hypothetical protein
MGLTRDNRNWQACEVIEVRHPVVDSDSDDDTAILSSEGNKQE